MEDTIETLQEKVKAEYETAGQLQYVIEVNKAQLQQANQRILELNNKAHALKNPPAVEPAAV